MIIVLIIVVWLTLALYSDRDIYFAGNQYNEAVSNIKCGLQNKAQAWKLHGIRNCSNQVTMNNVTGFIRLPHWSTIAPLACRHVIHWQKQLVGMAGIE